MSTCSHSSDISHPSIKSNFSSPKNRKGYLNSDRVKERSSHMYDMCKKKSSMSRTIKQLFVISTARLIRSSITNVFPLSQPLLGTEDSSGIEAAWSQPRWNCLTNLELISLPATTFAALLAEFSEKTFEGGEGSDRFMDTPTRESRKNAAISVPGYEILG